MKYFKLIFLISSWIVLVASLIGHILIFPLSLAEAENLQDALSWFAFPKIDLVSKFKISMMDTSNDNAGHLDTHELIKRAGFHYENYYALADDGYITQLIRIVNPLADSGYLKKPPIIIQHGQTANSRNFVMQSNKQHCPMPYPPPEAHNENSFSFGIPIWGFLGPVFGAAAAGGGFGHQNNSPNHHQHHQARSSSNSNNATHMNEIKNYASSNRSIAFMLANNGYDVWLSSTRGVDVNNMGYVPPRKHVLLHSHQRMARKNMSSGEEELLLERTRRSYWSFTLDDQIAHDLPAQIATVMNVTGAGHISLFGYSNTALTTFAMLSIRPDIAAFVDTYIASAPVVYYNKPSGWFKWFMERFMALMPRDIDAQLFLSDTVADFIRACTIRFCSNPMIRYTLCKSALDAFFGTSSQFRTLLEIPFFGHLLRQTSWKCLAQHVQIVRTHKLTKFDYGRKLNIKYYNSPEPPEYNISKIHPDVNIVLVSGEFDSWANQATLDTIRNRLPRKPALDLVVPDYNHLDLAGAYDVDVKVNLPILEFLEKRNQVLVRHDDHRSASSLAEHPVMEANVLRDIADDNMHFKDDYYDDDENDDDGDEDEEEEEEEGEGEVAHEEDEASGKEANQHHHHRRWF